MADLHKIASTFSIDLQPVGPLQERDHARLVDCLTQEIGPRAGAFLAEPVTNRDGSRTDWYIRSRSRAVALSSLAESEAADLRDQLSEVERQIEGLSSRLATSSNADDRHLASALANSLTVPGENCIYAVDGEPVLVAWGFSYARKPGYRGGLAKVAPMKAALLEQAAATRYDPVTGPETATGADRTAAPEIMEGEKRQKRGCLLGLLWLIFAFLVAAILYLLLRACAFGVPLPWLDVGSCRTSVMAAPIADLQRELADLESQLWARRDDCAREGQASLIPADVPPQPLREIDSRLAERNAQGGSLQVSLVWNGLVDLDLSVNCATGSIDFRNVRGCGGALDVDSNNGRNMTPQPVENVFWSNASDIPPGDLPIVVSLFNMRGEARAEVPYTVRIQRKNGDQVISERIINGVARRSDAGRPIPIGNANPRDSQ